jgi:hypothetical protein
MSSSAAQIRGLSTIGSKHSAATTLMYQHDSVPFNVESGKAQLDFKP